MSILSRNAYGKSGIRLAKLKRSTSGGDEIVEFSVDVELEGEFSEAYHAGDNSMVIATDSLKNAVYVLANGHPMNSIEGFALDLAHHFVSKYAQIERATISIRAFPWQRIPVADAAHPTAFVGSGGEVRVCRVRLDRIAGSKLSAGIDGLALLKSAGSSFSGFWDDEFRTLAETEDRILSTTLHANWTYMSLGSDDERGDEWNRRREAIRSALLECFATHLSSSLQNTLYTMGRAALDACEAVAEIDFALPNHHYPAVDLSPFGVKTSGELFLPSREPRGRITGSVARSPS